ncbi:hypothetical protein Tco_0099527 [Tanacetum coccineum]
MSPGGSTMASCEDVNSFLACNTPPDHLIPEYFLNDRGRPKICTQDCIMEKTLASDIAQIGGHSQGQSRLVLLGKFFPLTFQKLRILHWSEKLKGRILLKGEDESQSEILEKSLE